MSRLTIRNYGDAWRAFDLLCNDATQNVGIWFDNCLVTVDASAPIEGMRKARGFMALQVAIRRQFCWLKHGSRNIGRLSPADRAATEIGVEYHPNGRHIRYDLTRALNALASTVEQWDEYGPPWLDRTDNLFAVTVDKLASKVETFPHAARDVGVAFVASLTQKNRKALGRLAIIMGALALMAPTVIPESLKFASQRMDAASARQERMAIAERTTVVRSDGREAKLSDAQVAELEHGIDAEKMRVGALISDNIETPLLSFVVAEAEIARPSLLEMAPASWGTITINGVELRSEAAKAGAKAMRKATKQKREAGAGWVTKTIPAQDI
jgi:hypothetical protein